MSVDVQKTGSNTSSTSSRQMSSDENARRGCKTMAEEHETPQKRKKKRSVGNFKCDYEGCTKTFTRAEHLSRHKLNHNPSVIYKCGWEGCNKTFVRSDLKDRHVRRHYARMKKLEEQKQLELKSKKNLLFKGMGTLTFNGLNLDNIKPTEEAVVGDVENGNVEEGNSEKQKYFKNGSSITVMNLKQDNTDMLLRSGSETSPDLLIKDEVMTQRREGSLFRKPQDVSNSITPAALALPSNGLFDQLALNKLEIPSSPANISSWIDTNLMGNVADANMNMDSHNMLSYSSNNDFFFGLSPNSYMNEIFQTVVPQYPTTNDTEEYTISPEYMAAVLTVLPALATNVDANVMAFQRCLQIYWQLFHIQFPFLHRPSFVANEAPVLLVLSMVMLGAGLVSSTGRNENEYITDSRSLADSICVPLRWRLFESSDFELPVKTWVIQSLLILEYYEKFFATRNLHERTYIHHGAIIQLLRRSPTLGGNPTKSNHKYSPEMDEDLAGKTDEEKRQLLRTKWIDFESLKRTTLMAFYIDSTHSVIFGHLGILYAHQIQIEMPCDDDLWESNGCSFKLPSADLRPRPFLHEMRSLLKNQPVHTGVFGKRILMSGLLAIIFQLQQRDLQTSALGWDAGKEDSWKEYLSYILDYLTHDNMHGCCDTKSSVLLTGLGTDLFEPSGENSLRSYFAMNDTRCKHPAYHIAHIIMRISHYDLVIYSGAPWRMNVRPEEADYKLVKLRVERWAYSTSGKVSVIHALLYLFEMFLTPQNYNYESSNPAMKNYKYECLNDPIVERSYVIYMATLAVWAYCFTVEGPESTILSTRNDIIPANIGLIPEAEDGYSFLRRIRNSLSLATGSVLHTVPASDAHSFHQIVLQQAKVLPTIKHKKNITGLLRVVAVSLGKSNWQLAREFSVLFKHCVERSLGSEDLYCRNFYTDSEATYH